MMRMQQKLRETLEELKPKLKTQVGGLIAAAAVAFFIALYWDLNAPTKVDAHEPEPVETAATFIPAGFVLVPIEVSNFESLDSILGKFGVVDLYVPNSDPKKRSRKVATRIKILRAPLNPSRFAVLARESESSALVSHDGPFFVVIQNPERGGTSVVLPDENETPAMPATKHSSRSRITIEAFDSVEGADSNDKEANGTN